MQAYKQQSDFFERFLLAIPMVQDPVNRGAEGMKMLRICFAEADRLVRSEDPLLLFCILAIMYHLRKGGEKLYFLQVQLIRHLANLAAAMEASHHRHLAGPLRQRDVAHHQQPPLAAVLQRRDQAVRAAPGAAARQDLEWSVISMTFSEDGRTSGTPNFGKMLAGLDALGTFDERHAGLRMNYAAFFFRYAKYEESADVILAVLRDPNKDKLLRQHPFIAYKLWWRIGQIRFLQDNFDESEFYLGEALKIARSMDESGEKSNLLDCLVSMEKCLRKLGKTEEADSALRERRFSSGRRSRASGRKRTP